MKIAVTNKIDKLILLHELLKGFDYIENKLVLVTYHANMNITKLFHNVLEIIVP